jgi:CubicO group peptidase (beta-lactamase class C family)
MLTHHSGLPGDRFNGDFVEKPQPPDSLVRLMSLQSISSPPGTIFAYSNLAYSLLGVLAEKTAGRAYATLVGDSILSPLGMTASSFAQARDGTAPVAKTYRRGKPSPEHPMRDIAAGGLWTNVMDLARFMRMVFGGGELDGVRIVKRETLEEMLRPQNENMPLDLDFRIGLGWQIAPPGKLGWRGTTARRSTTRRRS